MARRILRDAASRLLRMRIEDEDEHVAPTLMVRSAATPRVSNHEARSAV
jgi:hypothetical protein